MVCAVCLSPERGKVDADIVRNKLGDRGVALRYGFGLRAIKRHRQHLPELLDEGSPSPPLPVIFAPTYNVVMTLPQEDEEEGEGMRS